MVLDGEEVFIKVAKCSVVGVETQFHQIGSGGRNVVDKETEEFGAHTGILGDAG